jgi:hypothetical protein
MCTSLHIVFTMCGIFVLSFAAFALYRRCRRKKLTPVTRVTAPLSAADVDYARMMYEENAEHARLHEELRGSATSLLVALIGGLLASTVLEAGAPKPIIGISICAVSMLGIFLNMKHYERYLLHLAVLRGFREQLEVALTAPLEKLMGNLRNNHEHERWLFSGIRTHYLWNLTFVVTFAIGVYVSHAAYTAPPPKVVAPAHAPA